MYFIMFCFGIDTREAGKMSDDMGILDFLILKIELNNLLFLLCLIVMCDRP